MGFLCEPSLDIAGFYIAIKAYVLFIGFITLSAWCAGSSARRAKFIVSLQHCLKQHRTILAVRTVKKYHLRICKCEIFLKSSAMFCVNKHQCSLFTPSYVRS